MSSRCAEQVLRSMQLRKRFKDVEHHWNGSGPMTDAIQSFSRSRHMWCVLSRRLPLHLDGPHRSPASRNRFIKSLHAHRD